MQLAPQYEHTRLLTESKRAQLLESRRTATSLEFQTLKDNVPLLQRIQRFRTDPVAAIEHAVLRKTAEQIHTGGSIRHDPVNTDTHEPVKPPVEDKDVTLGHGQDYVADVPDEPEEEPDQMDDVLAAGKKLIKFITKVDLDEDVDKGGEAATNWNRATAFNNKVDAEDVEKALKHQYKRLTDLSSAQRARFMAAMQKLGYKGGYQALTQTMSDPFAFKDNLPILKKVEQGLRDLANPNKTIELAADDLDELKPYIGEKRLQALRSAIKKNANALLESGGGKTLRAQQAVRDLLTKTADTVRDAGRKANLPQITLKKLSGIVVTKVASYGVTAIAWQTAANGLAARIGLEEGTLEHATFTGGVAGGGMDATLKASALAARVLSRQYTALTVGIMTGLKAFALGWPGGLAGGAAGAGTSHAINEALQQGLHDSDPMVRELVAHGTAGFGAGVAGTATTYATGAVMAATAEAMGFPAAAEMLAAAAINPVVAIGLSTTIGVLVGVNAIMQQRIAERAARKAARDRALALRRYNDHITSGYWNHGRPVHGEAWRFINQMRIDAGLSQIEDGWVDPKAIEDHVYNPDGTTTVAYRRRAMGYADAWADHGVQDADLGQDVKSWDQLSNSEQADFILREDHGANFEDGPSAVAYRRRAMGYAAAWANHGPGRLAKRWDQLSNSEQADFILWEDGV